jgi:predicted transcriptional regulator
MQDKSLQKLNKKEYNIVKMLQNLKVKKSHALVIVALADRRELKSFEIEEVTGLCQPDVSNTMHNLRKKDWVSVQQSPFTEKKGRPHNLYQLKYPLKTIIEKLEKQFLQEQQETFRIITKLKEST